MMIELSGATKLYGVVIGVNDISMSLSDGAYGLLGPNGSGKTTLLNLIIGQLRPTLGSVHVFGEDPWNNRPLCRRLGLCPAQDIFYWNVSGFDWVCYLTELYGFSHSQAADMARDAMRRVGMEHAMHRKIGSYSRGMKQRTKLAQSIVHEPELLILDEPFNGLDPVGRFEMTEMLREWVRDGRKLLMASHILYEVEAISPSFLLIRGGRVLASGSAEEIHSLLYDVPNEITLRCDQPRRLADLLVQCQSVRTLSLTDSDTLVVTTTSPMEIYDQLPQWTDSRNLNITEIRSTDSSLQALFNSLMKMHRGEL